MRRELSIVKANIKTFALDLSGAKVFTEAASGHFKWTPIIAAVAGAERVYAIAKDTSYGAKEEAAALVKATARRSGCEGRVETVYDYEAIAAADIVTNLGAVRPLTKEIVTRFKPNAVVPLMFETWEHRDGDVDLKACLDQPTLVLGTNEDHPDLQIFKYIGFLAAKLLFEADIELFRSKLVVAGGGKFGASIVEALLKNNAEPGVVCCADHIEGEMAAYRIGDSLASRSVADALSRADALIFAEHQAEHMLLGKGGDLEADKLLKMNPGIKIIHISGLIDSEQLIQRGFAIHPKPVAKAPRTMTVTTAYLGPRPVIELHTAGLKVGEIMAKAARKHATLSRAKREALQDPLCQDFSEHQLARYGFSKESRHG